MSPTQCMWSCFLLAFPPHNAHGHAIFWHVPHTIHKIMLLSNMPPAHFMWNQQYFLLFCSQCQLFSNIPPTQFTWYIKGILKSISNSMLLIMFTWYIFGIFFFLKVQNVIIVDSFKYALHIVCVEKTLSNEN